MIELTTSEQFAATHQAGLDAAAIGNIEQAKEAFSAAQFQMRDVSAESVILQKARLGRDVAFLGVRETAVFGFAEVEDRVKASVNSSLLGLRDSATETGILLEVGARGFAEEGWRFLNAEHGATIMLQARTLLFGAVAGGEDLRRSETMQDAKDRFAQAERFLAKGDNAYYGASNAVRAAGVERLLGNPLSVLDRLVEAAVYPAAIFDNMSDSKAAVLTVVSNGIRLPSKKAVRKGVLTKP